MKHKFLLPLAALASIVATGPTSANVEDDIALANFSAQNESNLATSSSIKSDQMDFILERANEGVMMARHYSHASHSSHSSHSSHFSHSSHYSSYKY